MFANPTNLSFRRVSLRERSTRDNASTAMKAVGRRARALHIERDAHSAVLVAQHTRRKREVGERAVLFVGSAVRLAGRTGAQFAVGDDVGAAGEERLGAVAAAHGGRGVSVLEAGGFLVHDVRP